MTNGYLKICRFFLFLWFFFWLFSWDKVQQPTNKQTTNVIPFLIHDTQQLLLLLLFEKYLSDFFSLYITCQRKRKRRRQKKVEKNKGPIHKHEYSINFTNNNNNKKKPERCKRKQKLNIFFPIYLHRIYMDFYPER